MREAKCACISKRTWRRGDEAGGRQERMQCRPGHAAPDFQLTPLTDVMQLSSCRAAAAGPRPFCTVTAQRRSPPAARAVVCQSDWRNGCAKAAAALALSLTLAGGAGGQATVSAVGSFVGCASVSVADCSRTLALRCRVPLQAHRRGWRASTSRSCCPPATSRPSSMSPASSQTARSGASGSASTASRWTPASSCACWRRTIRR